MNDPLAALAALPGVAETLRDARADVDRLLTDRALRRVAAAVSAECALRGARASAALEGHPVELEELRAGRASGAVVQGALRVSAETVRLAETWSRAPRQVLARLHTLAAADAVPPERLGRPRSDRDVSDPLDLGPPPEPREVRSRLEALTALLMADTEAPALAVAAVTHGELLTLRPFGWGDGIVARAAHRLTMVARGLDPSAVVVPEVGFGELGADAYARALRGYARGTQDGVAAWIQHCAEAVRLSVRDAMAVGTALTRG